MTEAVTAEGQGIRERTIEIAARLVAGVRVGAILRSLPDRYGLVRDETSRPVFPYLRIRKCSSYQILIYHRVHDDRRSIFGGIAPDLFRRQMEVLSDCFHVLPLEELLERAGRNDMPPRSIAITFDDGYRDNYEFAFPVLKEFRIPATIFLTTGPLDGDMLLLHDRLIGAFETTSVPTVPVGGKQYVLTTPADRSVALNAFRRHLRTRRIEEWEGLVGELAERLRVDSEGCGERSRKLTWSQISEMANHGIAFGAHTMTHPILTCLPLGEAIAEIQSSRASIEARLGIRVRLFAYPNGGRSDYNEAIKRELRDMGFLGALTNLRGANHIGSDPFELRRDAIGDADPRVSVLKLLWYKFAGQ